jgi:predicted dehydrogenase
MGLTIGISGIGQFGRHFVQLFAAHPLVDRIYLADIVVDRAREEAAKHPKVTAVYGSLEELCRSDCDAVALFTQRWLHADQAVQALRAGKHVYSAVPAAVTLDELDRLVQTVRETGLTYMLGETSYYRPQTTYCRQRFSTGDFGRFVYGEGQYHHDMAHFYTPYKFSGGDEWKRTASFPPMLYPTHSVCHVLGVTFSRMTHVSCFGFADDHVDGVFDEQLSLWGNRFSNQTALFRTADGGSARINEFRRIGAGESRQTTMGTKAAFEEQAPGSAVWSWLDGYDAAYANAPQIDWDGTRKSVTRQSQDVSNMLVYDGQVITDENRGTLPDEFVGRTHLGVSWVHDVARLPGEFVGLPNGHCGSHQFLVQDFVESITTDRLPPNNVWFAARLNAPGIVAHESSLRGGELLPIPDFGLPSPGSKLLDPLSALHA